MVNKTDFKKLRQRITDREPLSPWGYEYVIEALEDRIREIEELLRGYGACETHCPTWRTGDESTCTCGWFKHGPKALAHHSEEGTEDDCTD